MEYWALMFMFTCSCKKARQKLHICNEITALNSTETCSKIRLSTFQSCGIFVDVVDKSAGKVKTCVSNVLAVMAAEFAFLFVLVFETRIPAYIRAEVANKRTILRKCNMMRRCAWARQEIVPDLKFLSSVRFRTFLTVN